MPRNIVKQAGAPIASDTPKPIPTLIGGTSGAPPDPNLRSTVIHGGVPGIAPAPALSERSTAQRQFRVVGGPSEVMYAGQRMQMRQGKVYIDGCVDFDLLRNQGVVFQEVEQTAAEA